MILSASRRTDIPAYYGEWFQNRLREGFVLTRNPMNPSQERRIPLSPEDVDCIVFWTKDPAPFFPVLDLLDALGYRYYFQFTLTPYGRDLERNLRDKRAIAGTFAALAERIGPRRVRWRYDPILLNADYPVSRHLDAFGRLARFLSPHTETVTVSFAQDYAKLPRGLIRQPTEPEISELAGEMARTAKALGLRPLQCCPPPEKRPCGRGQPARAADVAATGVDLRPYGFSPAACVDKMLIGELCGAPLFLRRDRNQRPGCGCAESRDVGAYDTCPAGCAYCYATRTAARRVRHDPKSPFLTV